MRVSGQEQSDLGKESGEEALETMPRAVTKGRGPGIFPGYYKSEPRLLWYKTKILEREKCIKLENYELKNKPVVY